MFRKGSSFILHDFSDIKDNNQLLYEIRIVCKSDCHQVVRELSENLQTYITEKENSQSSFGINLLIVPITLGFMLILSILIIFEMYKKYQLFSIPRLHGYSLKRILVKEFFPIIVSQWMIMSVVFLVLSLLLTHSIPHYPEFLIKGLS